MQVEYCASCSYVAKYVIMRCMTVFDTWGSKVTFSLRLGSGSALVHLIMVQIVPYMASGRKCPPAQVTEGQDKHGHHWSAQCSKQMLLA